jgi:hypothetical protein
VRRLDPDAMPPIRPDGVTPTPWLALNETTLDRRFRPTFGKYLKRLDGKRVSLVGFMQPLGDGGELGSFMLVEYPVGCWFCEMPDATGIVYVELPAGKMAKLARGTIKVEGTLTLNATDPEDFLYAIKDAKVGGVD